MRKKLVFKNRTATEHICSSSDLTLTTVIDWSFIEGYPTVPWSLKKFLAVDFRMIWSCSKNLGWRRKIKWAVFMDNVPHLNLPSLIPSTCPFVTFLQAEQTCGCLMMFFVSSGEQGDRFRSEVCAADIQERSEEWVSAFLFYIALVTFVKGPIWCKLYQCF